MDQSLVAALRARGVDVITATEAAMLGSSDSEQWLFGNCYANN